MMLLNLFFILILNFTRTVLVEVILKNKSASKISYLSISRYRKLYFW